MSYRILTGDCRERLKSIPDNSIDAIVTDAPYELGFMGKGWDSSGIAYNVDVWRECFRVLKPGGHLLAFGGTRTHHRMTCAIEDAGFEIRDELDWLYGSGFPKSLDVSKAIDRELGQPRAVAGIGDAVDRNALDFGGSTGKAKNGLKTDWVETAPNTPQATEWEGWGTALKPAREPIVMARKPFDDTVAANVLRHGVGGINIDACRIATSDNLNGGAYSTGGRESLPGDDRSGPAAGMFAEGQGRLPGQYVQKAGRWPANLILTHSDACERIGNKRIKAITGTAAGRMKGKQSDVYGIYDGSPDAGKATGYGDSDGMETVEQWHCTPDCPVHLLDEQSGPNCGAAAPVKGTEQSSPTKDIYGKFNDRLPGTFFGDTGGASRFFYTAKTSKKERNAGCESLPKGNDHPTVKPIGLMRYLCKLVTPPGGLVLDPFAGSGSTGCAAVLEGFNFVGIELEPHHVEIAKCRIAYWSQTSPEPKKRKPRNTKQFKKIEEGPSLPL